MPTLSNQQYGFVKEIHVDADPATVMSLVGTDGDMITFVGNKITRTNTPGVYQDLVTTYQPSTGGIGCTSCAYDPLGNPLSMTDPRNNTWTFDRNELGEVYRTTCPAPYNYQVETSYDANRNTIQVDTQDVVVQYASDDPSDPGFGQFGVSGSGFGADLPTIPGPGGSVRPGWFSNLYSYDLIDNRIEDDIDSTGSVPASLVTTYGFDFNQNNILITRPLGNPIEFDYDERDLRIATRVGGATGSVTVNVYDPNGNLQDVIGPAIRGTAAQTLSCVIADAFNGGTNITYTGDWLVQNNYDGFDRPVTGIDPVGGTTLNTFDPGGRTIATQFYGAPGGPTPTDRGGSRNQLLSSGSTRFDEAGRAYEVQRDVFLDSGLYYHGVANKLPSGRTATHTGGGLAANSTSNNHTNTVTLTAGGVSYVLTRMVFDRSSRTAATASDNGAITTNAFDGANRNITITDPLNNVTTNTFDGNSNLVTSTRAETCTIPGVSTNETFASATFFDCLNRPIATAMQGPDGSFSPSLAFPGCSSWATLPVGCPPWLTENGTIFSFTGYDSRNNRTTLIDPKANTTVTAFDGANRQLQTNQHLRTAGSGANAISDAVTTSTSYDANSNLIRLVDDNGGATTWSFDLLDRDTVMTFHDGSTRTKVYNAASDIIGYTDENGSVFANTFDPLGRKTAVGIVVATGVVGTTAQTFHFDGLSRNTFARDSIGSTNADVTFVRDSIDRVLEEAQVYGGDSRYVTHDQWTSYSATGFTFPNGRHITNSFDALYRRTNVGDTGGSNIASWKFFGPSRTALFALGNGITCSFMNNAQTNSAIQSGGTYPPTWGDKTSDRLGYDGSGRMISKRFLPTGSTTSLVGFTTLFDPSSNKLFERALHAESRSTLYPSYDSMNRLLQYQRGTLASGGASVTTPITLPGTNNQQTYNLDGLGNWKNTNYTPEGASPITQTRTHNKLNELTQFATTPVHYDHGNNAGNSNPLIAQRGNGNITNDGTRIYAFDALNRLMTVSRTSDGLQVGAYVYDALGRRIRKVVTNGGVTGPSNPVANGTYRYVQDGNQIVEELTSSNATLRQFIWGIYIDELIQMRTYQNTGSQLLAPGSYFPLQDLLYCTTALTNASATVVEAYDTGAYGNTLIFSGPGSDGVWFTNDDVQSVQPACEYIFTGREFDQETQIYFFRARYYQPSLGRFVSKDPMLSRVVGFPDSSCRLGVTPASRLGSNQLVFAQDSSGLLYLVADKRQPHLGLQGERSPYAISDQLAYAYMHRCYMERWRKEQTPVYYTPLLVDSCRQKISKSRKDVSVSIAEWKRGHKPLGLKGAKYEGFNAQARLVLETPPGGGGKT